MAQLDVLVVDNEGGAHSEAVVEELRALGARVARYNLADLNRHHIVVRSGVVDLLIEEHSFRITASTSVWWRRQGGVEISHLHGDEAQLARDEGPHILRGALQAAGVRWVDDPAVVDRSELKLLQLQVASRLGNRVPGSTTTNDPSVARQLTATKRCIAKALSPGFGIAPYTDRVTDDDVDLVADLPVLLQEETRASADLRVVVVGGSAWVWRRQRSEETLDWRSEDPGGAGFCAVRDDDLMGRARQITFALGLSMSVQDWLETDLGPVFLESNAQGNWLFLEDARTKVAPILARHLVGETTPDRGHWPTPGRRMLYDFLPKKRAPQHDGARAPHLLAPSWAAEAATSPDALDVARRANDEAKAAAATAETKASRLVQVSLSVLAVAFVVGGIQLRMAVNWDAAWMLTMAPIGLALLFLTISTFQALQIDRVGFYSHPSGESLTTLGVLDPAARIVAEEEMGRQYAQWTSDHKHTDLMQARAWFTRGLATLILAAVLTLMSWLILQGAPTNSCDEICDDRTGEET